MATKKTDNVTMRVRIGEHELEVSGPSDFVQKRIEEFIKLTKEAPSTKAGTSKITTSELSVNKTKSGKQMSPAQFFKKINARTAVDRVLAAGYYLEIINGMENFTASEIRDTIQKKAKTQPPKNPSDLINNNIKKGYMMSAGDKDGKMAFVLTSDGEEFIKASLEQ